MPRHKHKITRTQQRNVNRTNSQRTQQQAAQAETLGVFYPNNFFVLFLPGRVEIHYIIIQLYCMQKTLVLFNPLPARRRVASLQCAR